MGGAARENYPDEKIAQSIYQAIPNLLICLWANHSYQNKGMFKDDIRGSIACLRTLLDRLEAEVNPTLEQGK